MLCFDFKMSIVGIFSGFSTSLLVWLVLLSLIAVLYMVLMKPHTYWARKGVKTTKILPIIGDAIFGLCFSKKPYPKLIQEIYNDAGDSRYIGYSELRTPLLMIKSPELIKKIFVKDADSFQDRRVVFPENFDSLMSKTLIYLRGQEWKDVRSIWNLVLTASKVETMYPLLNKTAESFARGFCDDKDDEVKTLDMKTAYRKYICDLSASTYFGIETGSETFRQKLSNFVTFNGNSIWTLLSFCIACLAPKLSPLFGVSSIVNKDVHNYFLKTVGEGVERENNNKHRPDIIGLLHKQKKEEESEEFEENLKRRKIYLNEDEIASQLCMFLLSSLDGLAATLGFITYELAVNPDVQKRLQKEMDDIRIDGELPDYQTIMGLPYLDMVVSETMRKWPAVTMTDRICTKPYTIEPQSPKESPVHLDVGDTVAAPLYALHHDPEYFPEPDKFDPERFAPENRFKIKPYSYLPWGIGPRNCNAGKLSLLQMKIFFFRLLEHFDVVPIDKTPIPINLQEGVIKVASDRDIFLGLRKRKDINI